MDNVSFNRRRKRRPAKETLHAETARTIKWLIATLTTMIIILIGGFLLTTNQSAQSGYKLQQEKQKNEELKGTNTAITNQLTTSSAIEGIEENEKLEEMTTAEVKEYITNDDNKVQ